MIPRVNALETDREEEDLAALVGPQIHGVSIGKVRSVDDIRAIDNIITKLEIAAGLRSGSVYLIPWIETSGRFPILRYKWMKRNVLPDLVKNRLLPPILWSRSNYWAVRWCHN